MLPDDEAKVDAWAIGIDSRRFMSRFHPITDSTLRRIIQHDGRDIGYVWIEKEGAVATQGLLGIMIGDEQYWNRGFGRQAVDLIIAEAERGFGIDSVVLRVRSNNPRAYQCYLASGFVVTEHGHKVSASGESFPIVTMQRSTASGLTTRCSERRGSVPL